MKLRVKLGVLAIFCVLSLLLGCASTGNLGIISKTTGDPGSLFSAPHPYKEMGPIKGEACRYILLGIIPWGDSTVTTAVNEARAKSGGGCLNQSFGDKQSLYVHSHL